MTKKIMDKFNALTNNEFEYIKLSFCDVFVKRGRLEVNLIYPADKEQHVLTYKDKIISQLGAALETPMDLSIKLKRSHFDFEFFKVRLFAFLNDYPSIGTTISDKAITCYTNNDTYIVTITLEKSVYDYCLAKKIVKPIEDFISQNFCEPIKIDLVSKDDTYLEFSEPEDTTPQLVLENAEGRYIRPQNVEDFIGNIIYDTAYYIEDANKAKEGMVLCGTVGKIFEIVRKPKEKDTKDEPFTNLEKKPERKFYKFQLTDFTGTVNCIYFPTVKTADQITLLKEGKQIICRGNLEEDTFKNDGSFTYKIKDISLCTLPKNFVVNRLKRKVPEKYSVVFPEIYIKKQQASLFEQLEKSNEPVVPPFAIGKTFCVFDIETTGFNPDFDSIIEIGAVKLVDGVVTETFSTFVNPKILLPQKIKTLTHIEDSDLVGQPLISDVLPDFYKFVDKTIIVGHNVQFDYSFISSKGKSQGIYFDNEIMDTLGLARKYFPQIGKYKLETLTRYFNVTNEGAHRAIYDAWATAEVFLQIIKMIV